jgi:hypothetical protein
MKGGNEVTVLPVYVPISTFEPVDSNAVIFNFFAASSNNAGNEGTCEVGRIKLLQYLRQCSEMICSDRP